MNSVSSAPGTGEGFDAQLIAVSGTPPRYSWVEQVMDPVTEELVEPDFARSGDDAREANDQTVDVPSYVRMYVRGQKSGRLVYEFNGGSGAGGSGSATYCNNNLAALQTSDCLTATGSAGASGSVTLKYNGSRWVSTDAITYPGGSGLVEFWYASGVLHLGVYYTAPSTASVLLELVPCGDGCWMGGPLTGHVADGDTACGGQTFKVCLACATCPTVTTPCCGSPVPENLHVTLHTTGTCTGVNGTYALTWNAGSSQWETSVPASTVFCGTDGSGGFDHFKMVMTCSAGHFFLAFSLMSVTAPTDGMGHAQTLDVINNNNGSGTCSPVALTWGPGVFWNNTPAASPDNPYLDHYYNAVFWNPTDGDLLTVTVTL